ncbi:ABC transporter permease [Ammoniphilus sp. CFH 90114]|uniref:ABC transporter permease n=1 Tax=Ammoniphilus sp. CFH 90114 TaxID=2493665 RepID=UPI00100F712C|nr:ABC transporter permease [Ammoniphilus sp. CFH 90114]RXT14013.1 ABC transporter permease [Ammoniphilus sp. CFH 90114]
MQIYIIKRLLQAVPLLLGITLISFFLMYLAPGGPTDLLMDPKIKPEDRERMMAALGLDQPAWTQYMRWLGNFVQGDFGTSFIRKVPVADLIFERLPQTLLLMGASFLFAAALSIPIGIWAARRKNTWIDYTTTFFAFLGLATPNFWLGILLIMSFSVYLNLLPAGGIHEFMDGGGGVWDTLRHLVLPALTLGTADMAGLTRYTRASMLDVLSQQYMTTARSKGLREWIVIYKHGLRNGLIPIVTVFGLSLPAFFGGAVIVEKIFSYPGIGLLFLDAVFQRDYPVIMAITTISAILVVLGNLLADILYSLLNPRINYR